MTAWRTVRVVAMGLAACGLMLTAGRSAMAQPQPAGPAARPILVFTHPDNDPPFAWLDETGAPRGALVDLWRQWGDGEGYTVQFLLVSTPATSRELVVSGRADAHAGETPDPAFDTRLMFGDTITERMHALYVRRDSPIQSLNDVTAIHVGALAGSFTREYMEMCYPDCRVTEYDTAGAMLTSAARGGVDAVVMDTEAMAWHTHREDFGAMFRPVGDGDENWTAHDALYLKKIRPAVLTTNPRLLSRLNAGLTQVGTDGVRATIAAQSPPRPMDVNRFAWPAAAAALAAVLIVLLVQMTRVQARARRHREQLQDLRDEHKNHIKELRQLRKTHKEMEEQLKFLNTHDSLTMLPTRRVLDLVFAQLAAQMARHGKMLAFLHVDLDDFKKINDRMGYAAGDTVLKQTAERLLAIVRASDIVVRLGGDEFVVVLTNLDKRQQAGEVAEKILRRLAEPFRVLGQEQRLNASIGISFYPSDGKGLAELLQHADQAMCVVKATGKNAWRIWHSDIGSAETGEAGGAGEADRKAAAPRSDDKEWPVEEAVGVDDLFDEPETMEDEPPAQDKEPDAVDKESAAVDKEPGDAEKNPGAMEESPVSATDRESPPASSTETAPPSSGDGEASHAAPKKRGRRKKKK